MNRGGLAVTGLALASLAATGCGGASNDDAARLFAPPPGEMGASIAVTTTSQRLYFGVTNHVHVAGDVVTDVALDAGAKVEIEAATTDSSPLRFELGQRHADGHMELDDAFDADSGFVLTNLYAPSDGTFVVHFPAPASARDVNVHLGCAREGARCTTELEPGERCFEASACAAGLACAPSAGACDAVWWGGTCVVPGDETACEGLPIAPACGCDGVTYDSECAAVASGKGMKSAGVCAPSPPPA
jgi:hypothetical protein